MLHVPQIPLDLCLQEWALTDDGMLKHNEMCLTLPERQPGVALIMTPCGEEEDQVSLHLFSRSYLFQCYDYLLCVFLSALGSNGAWRPY